MTPFDPSKSPDEHWRDGVSLNDSWLIYASDELTEQYRDARDASLGKRAFVTGMMETDVRLKIATGELLAFGIQTAPSPDNSATLIPVVFFQAESVTIDWERSELNGLGRSFSDVRVCSFGNQIGETDVSKNPPPEAVQILEKRGGGRTNKYQQVREILEVLFAEPSYAAMAAAPLLEAFNRAYLEKFRPPVGKISPIGERSLRYHLKRYRQELAETGRK